MTCCVNDAEHIKLDTLLRHLVVQIPSLPYVVALDLIRQRYIEFARKSGLLVAYVELPIQTGVSNYFIEAPEGYETFAIKGAGDPKIWTWQFANPNYWFSTWGTNFWVRNTNEVVFDNAPTENQNDRYLLLTVLPKECATTIPREIALPYGKGIAAGALADALNMPNKGWSNPSLANTHENKFDRVTLSARNLAITNRGAAPPQFRPVRIL